MKWPGWRNDKDLGCWIAKRRGWECDLWYDYYSQDTAQFYEIIVKGYGFFRAKHLVMPMREAKRLVRKEIAALLPAMLAIAKKRKAMRKGK